MREYPGFVFILTGLAEATAVPFETEFMWLKDETSK
jgi:hypothetical protein